MRLYGVDYVKYADDLYVYRGYCSRAVWVNPTKSSYIIHDDGYSDGEVWHYLFAIANTWWVTSAVSLEVLDEQAVRPAEILLNPPVDSQGFLVFDQLDLSNSTVIGLSR